MVITALTRNQVGGNVSWVRIPPTPLSRKPSKYAGLRLFYLFKRASHFMSFCIILCYAHGWIDNFGKSNWKSLQTYVIDRSGEIWSVFLSVSKGADGNN